MGKGCGGESGSVDGTHDVSMGYLQLWVVLNKNVVAVTICKRFAAFVGPPSPSPSHVVLVENVPRATATVFQRRYCRRCPIHPAVCVTCVYVSSSSSFSLVVACVPRRAASRQSVSTAIQHRHKEIRRPFFSLLFLKHAFRRPAICFSLFRCLKKENGDEIEIKDGWNLECFPISLRLVIIFI